MIAERYESLLVIIFIFMLRQVKKLFFCLHIVLSDRYQVSYNISLDLRPEVSYY